MFACEQPNSVNMLMRFNLQTVLIFGIRLIPGGRGEGYVIDLLHPVLPLSSSCAATCFFLPLNELVGHRTRNLLLPRDLMVEVYYSDVAHTGR
jgi:hypothetical protein